MASTTATDPGLPLLRLMHLVSPSLPVGGFTYSQGIEWAVEAGWIGTAADLEAWLADQLQHVVAGLDLPLLVRMHAAAQTGDLAGMGCWIDWLIAGRETAELRAEEGNRGRAMADLLVAWGLLGDWGGCCAGAFGSTQQRGPADVSPAAIVRDLAWRPVLARSQAAGLAFAAVAWGIDARDAALGYAWGWLENMVLAGIKLVPLGQTSGQQVLQRLTEQVPAAAARALALADDDIGASSPALAIASSLHETQYTRLFRS
jgi:urease accessory protein